MSIAEGMSSAKESVSSVTTGMASLGVLNTDILNAMTKATAMMQIGVGAAQMIKAAQALMEARSAVASADAAAKTALLSATGIGLGQIALATTVTAATSVAVYEIMDKVIFADMNNSADRGRVSATIEAMI